MGSLSQAATRVVMGGSILFGGRPMGATGHMYFNQHYDAASRSLTLPSSLAAAVDGPGFQSPRGSDPDISLLPPLEA